MAGEDRITTSVHASSALTQAQWDEIWTLTAEYYDVDRGRAEQELRLRQRIALFHMNGALLGMASIDVYPAQFRGRAIVVINTAHVLLRENWRGRNLLQRLGFRTFLAERLRNPLRPIYWFFDSFSYKSYLLLPRNFASFWPRYDEATPPDVAELIDHLAARAYGASWKRERGVVERSGYKRLRATAAPLALTADSDPNLLFFAGANPGHADGDMLVCLCPLTLSNWLSLLRKLVDRRDRRTAH